MAINKLIILPNTVYQISDFAFIDVELKNA